MADPFNNQLDHDVHLQSQRNMYSITSAPSHTNEKNYSAGTLGEVTKINAQLDGKDGNFNLSGAAHPIACIATIFFKGTSLFLYIFVGILLPNVITFILVMVTSALDFWTVKNVTGRLLVGLRWWSQYSQSGQQVWRFESFDKHFQANAVDKAFFWTGQIVATATWGFFLLIKILSLNLFWGILTGINFAFSAINLYGYIKCRGQYQNKLKTLQSMGLRHIAGKLFF